MSAREVVIATKCQLLTGSFIENTCPCEHRGQCRLSEMTRESLRHHPKVIARLKENQKSHTKNSTNDGV